MIITTKTILNNPIRIQQPKPPKAKASDIFTAHITLVILFTLGLVIVVILADSPYFAVLVLDTIFCVYLVSLFKNNYRFLFILHPVILFISSQLITESFISSGDGDSYYGLVATYLNTQDFSFNLAPLWESFSPFEFFKYTSLGVVPTFAVPEFFFGNPTEEIYYLWQGAFHVFLCLIVITLAQTWHVVDAKFLFAMSLFVVMSPTCFELGASPTRHYVTLFGVFLLINAHLALVQRITFSRAIWYVIALAMIVISKAPLLATYFIFVFMDMFYIRRFKLNTKSLLVLGMFAVGLFLIGGYFLDITSEYKATSEYGAATFSGYVEIPLIGWAVKYVYALLSPFPWSDAPLYIENNYAGNWLLFFMHILSSLSGLYMFFIIILKWRLILASDTQLKQLVAFGLIMSLSILKGSTGFHGYLSIYFPMLAPLLTIKQLQINPMLPIGFVVIIELFVMFFK